MSRCSTLPSTFPPRREAGSAIVFVLLTICVLSVVAASLLFTNVSRYQTAFQSASWQEAIVGSEAGVDLVMNELRKRVVTGPSAAFQTNWAATSPQTGKAYTDFGRAFPANNQPYEIATHSGEGNTTMRVRVFVDAPGSDAGGNFAQVNDSSFISQIDNPNLRDPDGVDRSRWLFRIKSLGITGLTGPPRPNLNKYDNLLRRFSFFSDWRTGRAVSSPQVARMVEAIVRPRTGFRNALMSDKKIDLNNQDVLVDSYDSSKGNYDGTTNHGDQGNIATNGQLINANSATVHGNAMTNNGSVKQGENVTGQQSSTFYQELTPLTTAQLNPSWSGVKDDGTVTTSTTYTASGDINQPTLVRLDGINLSRDAQVIAVNSPATTSTDTVPQSYIKLYVQGDLNTTGTSYINLAVGVNAIIYVTGNVDLQGNGIINNSYLPSHLVVNGIQPPANKDGSFPARSITIATGQDFQGIVYAPDHDLDLALQAVSSSIPTPAASIPKKVQDQIDKLEKDAVKADKDAAKAMDDYNNDMARYNQSLLAPAGPLAPVGPLTGPAAPVNPDYAKAQQDLAKAQQAKAKATDLRQQEATLLGQYNQATYEDHVRGYNGIYGGFVARTIKVENKTHIHYDETLRTAGPVNHYEIVNWFEDNLSHDATGGTEIFWWSN